MHCFHVIFVHEHFRCYTIFVSFRILFKNTSLEKNAHKFLDHIILSVFFACHHLWLQSFFYFFNIFFGDFRVIIINKNYSRQSLHCAITLPYLVLQSQSNSIRLHKRTAINFLSFSQIIFFYEAKFGVSTFTVHLIFAIYVHYKHHTIF